MPGPVPGEGRCTHGVGIRVIIAHLQEPLGPRRGVLRPLKAKARRSRLAEGRGRHTGQKPGRAGTRVSGKRVEGSGRRCPHSGAQTTGKTQKCGSGVGKAPSEGSGEPARVGGSEGEAEACLQHVRPSGCRSTQAQPRGPHVSPRPCKEPRDADTRFLALQVKMVRGKEMKKQPKTHQPEGQM